MLTLDDEQTAALEAWAEQRFRRRLAAHFSQAWPAAAQKVGERLGEFIELGIGRARKYGLIQGRDIARYLNLCFVWGAGFEERAGFEWARALLDDVRRDGQAKARQLMLGSREQLQRAGNAKGVASFDAAETLLRRDLADLMLPSQWWPPEFVRPWVDSPCDIDALLLWVEHAARPEYRHEDGRWQALPGAPLAPLRLLPSAALPERIALLAGPWRDGTPARFGLRLKQAEVCDAARHPRVVMALPDGLREWRGAAAMELDWRLRADVQAEPLASWPADAADSLPLAGAPIAFEGAPRYGRLTLETCALRDGVAPLGSGDITIAVWPATQHLLDWRLPPAPAATVDVEGLRIAVPAANVPGAGSHHPAPAVGAGHNAAADTVLVTPDIARAHRAAPAVRIERDGNPLPPAGWSAGLAGLQDAWLVGLARLHRAWSDVEGMTLASVTGRCDLLAGDAGLTWGRHADALDGDAWLRVAARFDLAGAAELVLGGEFVLGEARARLKLVATGAQALRGPLARDGAGAALPDFLVAARRQLRLPFTAQVAPMCGESAATLAGSVTPGLAATGPLHSAAVPIGGALVGDYGLRARRDGQGWQWFATLKLEPVAMLLTLHDPLLGQTALPRALLPAIDLLDWSLG